MRNRKIFAVAGCFFVIFFFSNRICSGGVATRFNPDSIKDHINSLNKDYAVISNLLEELEVGVRGFPDTSLTFALKKEANDIELTSIEIWENVKLINSHLYTSRENIALDAGGNHQLYRSEIKKDYHVYKVIFYCKEKGEEIFKSEVLVNIFVKTGKSYLVQLKLEKKQSKTKLLHSLLVFKSR